MLGITAHRLLGDTYLAIEGEGCFHNGRRIEVSDITTLAAVVALDMGYDAPRGGQQLGLAAHLWPGMQSLRITGSAALGFAYVAAAKWDIYVHSDLQPWDIAPGLILVREAGGDVLNSTGAPATLFSREAVAASRPVLQDFSRAPPGFPGSRGRPVAVLRFRGIPWEGGCDAYLRHRERLRQWDPRNSIPSPRQAWACRGTTLKSRTFRPKA